MRYGWSADEEYPVFSLDCELNPDDRRFESGLELTSEEYADYERVMREYDAWQQRIEQHEDALLRRLGLRD